MRLAAGDVVLGTRVSTKDSKMGGTGATVRRNRSQMNGLTVMTGCPDRQNTDLSAVRP